MILATLHFNYFLQTTTLSKDFTSENKHRKQWTDTPMCLCLSKRWNPTPPKCHQSKSSTALQHCLCCCCQALPPWRQGCQECQITELLLLPVKHIFRASQQNVSLLGMQQMSCWRKSAHKMVRIFPHSLQKWNSVASFEVNFFPHCTCVRWKFSPHKKSHHLAWHVFRKINQKTKKKVRVLPPKPRKPQSH